LDVPVSDAAYAPRGISRPPAGDLALLLVAVLAISSSAPIIAATAAPALAISFWRCLLGSGATLPFAALRHTRELRGLSRDELRWTAIAGLLLAAHFAMWVPSLRFTSVASSTALVATQPVWAAFIARRQGVYIARSAWVGIALALLGVVVLTGVDFALDPRALIGDAMALAGGMLSAAYVTAGHRVRQTVSTPTYTTLAYAVSALALLPVCLVLGVQLTGFSADDWVKILALTAGAQLLGHTLMALVLRSTSATVVSLAVLFEVPGAILIAALWLGQVPPLAILPAVLLLFAGLVLVIRSGDRVVPTETPPV
jgi:drug/metabolite transporter (DMT)-like permease